MLQSHPFGQAEIAAVQAEQAQMAQMAQEQLVQARAIHAQQTAAQMEAQMAAPTEGAQAGAGWFWGVTKVPWNS